MRNIFTLLVLAVTLSLTAQSPEKISYQAVIRDAGGNLLTNQEVGIQMSILQSSNEGSPVYTEIHTVSSNANGIVSLELGSGTTSDNFQAIDWTAGPYFLKVETDPSGGSSYSISGTSQLLSVPYALHAKTVENESQQLLLSGTQLTLSPGGGTVNLPTGGSADNWGTQNVETGTGLVGNGTSASPLSVVGDLTDDQTLSLSGSNLSISGGNSVNLGSLSGGSGMWDVDGNDISYTTGKVGIGTISSSADFSVVGSGITGTAIYGEDVLFGIKVKATDPAAGYGGYFTNESSGGAAVYGESFGSYHGVAGEFKAANTDGIGLKAFGEGFGGRFESIGDGTALACSAVEGIGMVSSNNSTNLPSLWITNYNSGPSALFFGNVGIDISVVPHEPMEIGGTGRAFFGDGGGDDRKGLLIDGIEGSSAARIEAYDYGAGSGLDLVLNTVGGGYVGIGTTSPSFTLQVNGTAGKTGGGSWSTVSDIRLKDVHGGYDKGLEEISSLRTVTFSYKKDNPLGLPSDAEQVGFVAQEVQEIFPEAVTENQNGYLDFNMHAINVALVNAVKELNAENEALREENQQMNARLELIEEKLGISD